LCQRIAEEGVLMLNDKELKFEAEQKREQAQQAQRDGDIALIIQQQLGRQFFFMTGAHTLICGNVDGLSYLQFRFPMNPKMYIARILLDSDDTYTLTFYGGRQFPKVVVEESHVYCDQLHERFEAITGLRVQMPRVVRR
jgi:hypothetical protein